MEGVYHVHVVEVGRSSLIGDIHGVTERKVPYREGLEFGIACIYSPFMLMVELRKAGGHFSASGTGSCYDNESARCHDIIVLAVAFVAYYVFQVGRIALDAVMVIHLHAKSFKSLLEGVCGRLIVVPCENDAAYVKTYLCEYIE